MSQHVVVVDDEADVREVIAELLTREGFEVTQFSSAAEALQSFKVSQPQVLITDYQMETIDGLAFLRKVQTDYPDIVTIMMTAFGSIETAIEAMKNGAYHYICKPFKSDELILLTKRAFEKANLKQENQDLKMQLNRNYSLDAIIGKSQAMAAVFDLIRHVSSTTANVLITGESGSGKELVARALHYSGSRKNKPFVPINCTAIPEQLLESELFGHVKGAFTGAVSNKKGLFEEAQGGTLFLDEIGDLSLTLQAKLLRVLQDKQIRAVGDSKLKNVDVRIVAATHRGSNASGS